MRLALVVISDRGERYLPQCLAAAEQWLTHPIAKTVIVQDPEHTMTASGAVRHAWLQVDADFVFHLEEDFLLTEPVDIRAMAQVLKSEPKLAQLVLKRQPWNTSEIEANDLLGCWSPSEYTDRRTVGHDWVEQRRLFSLNPCLIPREVIDLGFPEGSERGFTELLLAAGYRFGYWGKSTDPPRCEHIGRVKAAGSRM